MKKQNIAWACLASLLLSCNSEPVDKITGVYVRESSSEHKNINTEKVVGMVHFRDSIFVIKKKAGYQVDNSKWRKNDYDDAGWQALSFYNGKRRTIFCAFDITDKTLVPNDPSIGVAIYLDLDKGLLSFDKDRQFVWKRVK
ncbi:hypothetical protein D3C87_298680 [compost metagenome]